MDFLYLGIFGIGLIVGAIIGLLFLSSSKTGTLRIDESDIEGGTYLFLELDKPIHKSISKKYVVFKVKRENYISLK